VVVNTGETPETFVSSVVDPTLWMLFKEPVLSNKQKGFIVERGFDKSLKFINDTLLRGTKCKVETIFRDNNRCKDGHGSCDRILVIKHRGQTYKLGVELHNHAHHYVCGPEEYERNGRSKFYDRKFDTKAIAGSLTYSKNIRNECAPKDDIDLWDISHVQIRNLGDYLVAMERLVFVRLWPIIEKRKGLIKELRKVARRFKLTKINRLYKEWKTREVHMGVEGLNVGREVVDNVFEPFIDELLVVDSDLDFPSEPVLPQKWNHSIDLFG